MSTQDLNDISGLEEDDSGIDVRHVRKRRYQGDGGPSYVFIQLKSDPGPYCFTVSWTIWTCTRKKTPVCPTSLSLTTPNISS